MQQDMSNLGLDVTLNNESIQQLSDSCGDRDAWRDRLAEYGVKHEVTPLHDLSVPDDDMLTYAIYIY